jgi:Fe-S-cluster-containing hydrogenase component 2
LVTAKKGPPITVNAAKCAGCLICELRCSLRFEKVFNPSKSKIIVLKLVGQQSEHSITFASECDNCGICARYCFYGALTQEQKKGVH